LQELGAMMAPQMQHGMRDAVKPDALAMMDDCIYRVNTPYDYDLKCKPTSANAVYDCDGEEAGGWW